MSVSKDGGSIYSPAQVPSLLHACRESRRFALKWYKLSFADAYVSGARARTYFDPTVDGLLIQCNCEGWCKYRSCIDFLYRMRIYDAVTIKKVLVENNMPIMTARDRLGGDYRVSFLGAEEVIVIEGSDFKPRTELALSTVVENTKRLWEIENEGRLTWGVVWSKDRS
jgi:hypothetical protein